MEPDDAVTNPVYSGHETTNRRSNDVVNGLPYVNGNAADAMHTEHVTLLNDVTKRVQTTNGMPDVKGYVNCGSGSPVLDLGGSALPTTTFSSEATGNGSSSPKDLTQQVKPSYNVSGQSLTGQTTVPENGSCWPVQNSESVVGQQRSIDVNNRSPAPATNISMTVGQISVGQNKQPHVQYSNSEFGGTQLSPPGQYLDHHKSGTNGALEWRRPDTGNMTSREGNMTSREGNMTSRESNPSSDTRHVLPSNPPQVSLSDTVMSAPYLSPAIIDDTQTNNSPQYCDKMLNSTFDVTHPNSQLLNPAMVGTIPSHASSKNCDNMITANNTNNSQPTSENCDKMLTSHNGDKFLTSRNGDQFTTPHNCDTLLTSRNGDKFVTSHNCDKLLNPIFVGKSPNHTPQNCDILLNNSAHSDTLANEDYSRFKLISNGNRLDIRTNIGRYEKSCEGQLTEQRSFVSSGEATWPLAEGYIRSASAPPRGDSVDAVTYIEGCYANNATVDESSSLLQKDGLSTSANDESFDDDGSTTCLLPKNDKRDMNKGVVDTTSNTNGLNGSKDNTEKKNGEEKDDKEDEGKTFSWKALTRKQLVILVSTSFTNLLSFLSLSILAPFFPLEAENKGVNNAIAGWIFGIFALMQFLLSPLFGRMLPVVGCRFMYISGLFVCGGCTLLFGILDKIDTSDGIAVFVTLCFVTRILLALGCTGLSNAGFVMLVKTFPDNVATVFGIGEVFTGVGMVTGPALGGFLYSAGGFILPFAVIGICCFVALPIVWFYLPEQDDSQTANEDNISLKEVLIHPRSIVNSLVIVVAASVWAVLDPTLEPHLRVYGLGPEMVGVLFLIMAAFYSISSPVWGSMADRLPDNRALLVPGLLLCAVGLLLLGPSPVLGFDLSYNELWLTIISLIVLGLASSMCVIPTYDIYIDVLGDLGYPEDTRTFGMISGLWVSMYALGDFAGPSLGGFVFDEVGFEWLATGVAGICVLTSFIVCVTWFIEKNCCVKSKVGSSPPDTITSSFNSDYLTERSSLVCSAVKTDYLTAGKIDSDYNYPPSSNLSSSTGF